VFTATEKLLVCALLCVLLSLLLPVVAPLLLSLFLGVMVRESGLSQCYQVLSGPLLYGATLFLGLLLGVLCEAHTLLHPQVWGVLLLGALALLLAGLGGLLGGYLLYFASGRRYNPVIGIAGVSGMPGCARVAQQVVAEVTPAAMILPQALGATISGMITSVIVAGLLLTVLQRMAFPLTP
jgi:oxaloacetate decarboxylase beta subunit